MDADTKYTCIISISCETILDNIDKCVESKKALVPEDGIILPATEVTFSDGESVYDELDGKTAFIDQSLVAENRVGRLNFTVMHEAAHQLFWMLYPEEYEAQIPRCVFRMTDEHTQYPVLDWEEWQTNVLTSFLLLPKELVYRHMADVGLKDGISVLNRIYARKDYERFSEAAKRLGVSKTALTIRLSQLGLVGRNDLYDPYALVDIFPEKNEIA